MTFQNPLISVIVLNYNGKDLLPDCLSSLCNQSYLDFEIIVADNGSTDESKQIVCRYNTVKFLELGRNYGFGKGNNLAAKSAKGEYIFFVNNDMRFDKDCVWELVKVIKEDENIFAVDATQYNWEGTRIIHGKTLLLKKKKFFTTFLPFFEIDYTGKSNSPVPILYGCAGSLMVRENLFHKLGGFDETFIFDCEDLDLCWRAWMDGWKIIYVPSAYIYHKGSASFNTERLQLERKKSNIRNQIRFSFKVLPWHMIFLIGFRQHLKVLYHLFAVVNLREACIDFKEFWKIIFDSPIGLLKERIKIRKKSIFSSIDLLKQFAE